MPILPFDTINSSHAPVSSRRTFRESDFSAREVPHMQQKARAVVLQPDYRASAPSR
jgi:hypothetical protein